MIPPLYKHQKDDVNFILSRNIVANFSDPGTGKTRTALEAINARAKEGRTLIICPKSIMEPAWGNDIKKFTPHLTYNLAYAEKRLNAFTMPSDIVIMNHDGVAWLAKNLPALASFTQLFVDESTAYKNHSQRTKAIFKICEHFKYRVIMTGTPYTNSITDVWRQAFVLDNGERLGKSYFRFREATCKPRQLGNGVIIWEDKDGMEPIIFQLLADITIRHKLEDCIDIPPNTTQDIPFTLNDTHYQHYKTLERDSILELQTGKVTAVNAAVLRNKLLQVASGAVYNTTGDPTVLDHDRYELIRDLAEARPQTIIAYQWKHQRDILAKLIPDSAVIGGDTPMEQRYESINAFQAGHIRHLIVHPKTGAHGLTLTAGHATIWASPPPSPEAFTQFNRRIYRAGQTKKTETLLVTAKNTVEGLVYERLNGKLLKADLLLELFNLTEETLNG